MQRLTQTTRLTFSLRTLAQNQRVVCLPASLTDQPVLTPQPNRLEHAIAPQVETTVITSSGLRNRARCRFYRRMVLLALMGVCAMATASAQDQEPAGKKLPTTPSALMRAELGASEGTSNAASSVAASVNGTVMDDSGALFPGAKEEIETTSHGDSRTATAGEDAAFRFDGLKPNVTYVVTVAASR